MSGYGQNYDTSGVKVFKSGINDNVVLTKFELVNVDTAKYRGETCLVTWEKDGQNITARFFPVNEADTNPRVIKEKDASGNLVDRMQTKQEAIDEAYGRLNSHIKHIAGCAVSDDEWKEAVKGAKDFASFITAAAKLVEGKNYTGQLVLGYKGKYLNIPAAMYVIGAYWSVGGRHQLVFQDKKNFNAAPPAPVAQEQAANTDW